jgi:hypothetical protein
MGNRLIRLAVAASLLLVAGGCSWRSWYAGIQQQQRNDCYHLGAQRDIQTCLERVDRLTYDDYQRLRQERIDADGK